MSDCTRDAEQKPSDLNEPKVDRSKRERRDQFEEYLIVKSSSRGPKVATVQPNS